MNKPVIKIQFNESFGLYDYKVTKNEIGEIFKPEEGSIVRGITLEEKNTLENRINELNEKYGEPITIESLIEEYKDMSYNLDIINHKGEYLYYCLYDIKRNVYWLRSEKIGEINYPSISHKYFTNDLKVAQEWTNNINCIIANSILRENINNKNFKIQLEESTTGNGSIINFISIRDDKYLGDIYMKTLERLDNDVVGFVVEKLKEYSEELAEESSDEKKEIIKSIIDKILQQSS